MKNDLYRIIDANLNRSKEGLRVCEDVARYIWNKPALTKSLKDVRHELTKTAGSLGMLKILESRDVASDVGRSSSASELKRKDMAAVFGANMQRVKESLRVLEEISKLLNPTVAEGFKSLRYKAYVLEQKALKAK
jgi:hypothetical protein